MQINFILNSVNDAHSIKRVDDFKKQGHDVKIFGFLRDATTSKIPNAIILGCFSNKQSYKKRISTYYKGIKCAFKEEKRQDILWYYLGLDVALFALLVGKKRTYIYEECDLVQLYIRSSLIKKILEKIDKVIIRLSKKTLITSEGFIDFHYHKRRVPNNIVLVPNKLTNDILQYPVIHRQLNMGHIRFAFVGVLRAKSLLSIANSISKNFPQHNFSFYGFIAPTFSEKDLPQRANINYHGRYQSPNDLPSIYSKVDVLICTYDISGDNVKYAEPNKLYEAIYFGCPIVVSDKTFLAQKVKSLNIGYSVNPFDEQKVIELVKRIEYELPTLTRNLQSLKKQEAIGNLSYINELLK